MKIAVFTVFTKNRTNPAYEAARPDAIVLAPVHATRVNAAIGRIHEAGVPLFGFIYPTPGGRCVADIGADDGALELSRYLFIWLMFIGAVIAVHERAHVGADFLRAGSLSPR